MLTARPCASDRRCRVFMDLVSDKPTYLAGGRLSLGYSSQLYARAGLSRVTAYTNTHYVVMTDVCILFTVQYTATGNYRFRYSTINTLCVIIDQLTTDQFESMTNFF